MRIPACIALRMLRGDPAGSSVRTTEDNRTTHLAAGHVQRLRGGIDDLVDGLHGKVEGHELDNRPQFAKGGTDSRPANPCSVIGVSITRFGPNSASSPCVTL